MTTAGPVRLAYPVDLDMRRPFTRAEAMTAGVSPSALKGPNFRRIFRGVYIHASVPQHPLIRIQAALLIHPGIAFASHQSGARVYELPIPDGPEEHVSVFDHADRRRRTGIRNHVARTGSPVTVVKGVRVSTPAQVFVELAGVLGLVDLVVAGDDLVRRHRITPEDLGTACVASADTHAVRARRAARYIRRSVDSPMESRLRMLLVLAGLPEPDVNHEVFDEQGRRMYRFDLCYPDLKLIAEYDGRQHRDDLNQWDHDTSRRDWLDHNGWMIVPVFSRGIYKRPDQTVARVHASLTSRCCKTLPRVLSDDWRPFFPVRR